MTSAIDVPLEYIDNKPLMHGFSFPSNKSIIHFRKDFATLKSSENHNPF